MLFASFAVAMACLLACQLVNWLGLPCFVLFWVGLGEGVVRETKGGGWLDNECNIYIYIFFRKVTLLDCEGDDGSNRWVQAGSSDVVWEMGVVTGIRRPCRPAPLAPRDN